MSKLTDWQKIEPLGEGGQSNVFLARTPQRTSERQKSISILRLLSGTSLGHDTAGSFAEAAWNCARPELPSELGALKYSRYPQ
jgi:hypothetical protein